MIGRRRRRGYRERGRAGKKLSEKRMKEIWNNYLKAIVDSRFPEVPFIYFEDGEPRIIRRKIMDEDAEEPAAHTVSFLLLHLFGKEKSEELKQNKHLVLSLFGSVYGGFFHNLFHTIHALSEMYEKEDAFKHAKEAFEQMLKSYIEDAASTKLDKGKSYEVIPTMYTNLLFNILHQHEGISTAVIVLDTLFRGKDPRRNVVSYLSLFRYPRLLTRYGLREAAKLVSEGGLRKAVEKLLEHHKLNHLKDIAKNETNGIPHHELHALLKLLEEHDERAYHVLKRLKKDDVESVLKYLSHRELEDPDIVIGALAAYHSSGKDGLKHFSIDDIKRVGSVLRDIPTNKLDKLMERAHLLGGNLPAILLRHGREGVEVVVNKWRVIDRYMRAGRRDIISLVGELLEKKKKKRTPAKYPESGIGETLVPEASSYKRLGIPEDVAVGLVIEGIPPEEIEKYDRNVLESVAKVYLGKAVEELDVSEWKKLLNIIQRNREVGERYLSAKERRVKDPWYPDYWKEKYDGIREVTDTYVRFRGGKEVPRDELIKEIKKALRKGNMSEETREYLQRLLEKIKGVKKKRARKKEERPLNIEYEKKEYTQTIYYLQRIANALRAALEEGSITIEEKGDRYILKIKEDTHNAKFFLSKEFRAWINSIVGEPPRVTGNKRVHLPKKLIEMVFSVAPELVKLRERR